METFSALLALCAGNSPVTGEFPSQRPVTWSFDVSFDLRLNNRLSKQTWGWWFETPSRSSWRHPNVLIIGIRFKRRFYNRMVRFESKQEYFQSINSLKNLVSPFVQSQIKWRHAKYEMKTQWPVDKWTIHGNSLRRVALIFVKWDKI